MPQKAAKKAVKSPVREPKSLEEIKRELREQWALDPGRSEMKNYIARGTKHFGL